MSKLEGLRNIGSTLAKRLEEIGVFDEADLKAMGSATAYRRFQTQYPDANLPLCYYLYSLEGALQNKDWRSFTAQQKADMQSKAGV